MNASHFSVQHFNPVDVCAVDQFTPIAQSHNKINKIISHKYSICNSFFRSNYSNAMYKFGIVCDCQTKNAHATIYRWIILPFPMVFAIQFINVGVNFV